MISNSEIRELEPFYFGDTTGSPLYGCYHPAQAARRSTAVVFCAPLGDEGIRIHRAYKQLALRLSRAGFASLRFDYFGTGDSAGEDFEASLRQWQADINLAIEETKQRSGAAQVILIGLRLGAALALRTASHRQDIRGLVLWEPVTSGREYLQALEEAHQNRLNYFLTDPANNVDPSSTITELMGFALSETMRQEIEQLNLFEVSQLDAVSAVLLVEKAATDAASRLQDHLLKQSINVVYQCLDDPAIWGEDPDKALIPGQTLKAVMSWISEKYL